MTRNLDRVTPEVIQAIEITEGLRPPTSSRVADPEHVEVSSCSGVNPRCFSSKEGNAAGHGALERSITTRADSPRQLYWPTAGPETRRASFTAEQRHPRQRPEQQGLLVEEPAGLMISAAVSYSLRLPIELEGEFSVIYR